MSARHDHERGAALLTVLLLVAVMAAISVVALEKLRLATHLAFNAHALDQARAYALGAESLAIVKISDLGGRDNGRTTLAGGWHGRPLRIPFPGGNAVARMIDGGNCFNLNSVGDGRVRTELTQRPLGIAQFTALMREIGIGGSDARRIAAALADWVDGDSVPSPGGAEDSAYRREGHDYRTGNTLLAEPSELRAIAGVTPEIYARLRPWVCTLPTTDLSPLNVNTLSADQAPLLAMLLPGQLDTPGARAMIEARPRNGWETPESFWALPALKALVPPMEVQQQTKVRTRWFLLRLDVEVAGAQVTETALIDGGFTPGRIAARRWGSDE